VDQIYVSRDFGDKDLEGLVERLKPGGEANDQDWQQAITVFDKRMHERFWLCIETLLDIKTEPLKPLNAANPDRPIPKETLITTGFAIMALRCLLIETLQFFRAGEGPKKPHQSCRTPENCAAAAPSTRQAFISFLTECLSFERPEAKDFNDDVRNGIFHQGETRRWVIKRDEPKDEVLRCESIKPDQANDKVVKLYILNRTVFCKKLREWYDGYVKRLRDPNDLEATDLRQHFVAGIEHVVEMCRKSD